MNGMSWFPETRTIWAMPRGHRPQGVGHGHGHTLGALGFIFRKVVETKPVAGDNNEWFELVSGDQDHLGHAQRP